MMLVLFLVIFVTIKLNQLMQLTRAASSVDGQTVRLTERLSNNMFSMVGFEKKYLISRDNDFYRRFLRIKNDFNTDLQQLRLLMDGSEKNKKFSETRGLCDKYFSILRHCISVISHIELVLGIPFLSIPINQCVCIFRNYLGINCFY